MANLDKEEDIQLTTKVCGVSGLVTLSMWGQLAWW